MVREKKIALKTYRKDSGYDEKIRQEMEAKRRILREGRQGALDEGPF